MTGQPRIARIYFSLRTAHLERFRQLEPSAVIYREARYDFDPAEADLAAPPRRMGRIATVWHLLTHSYDVVELNEPAIAWLWGDLLLQVAAVRVRSALTRSHTSVVTYCIALVDPATDAAGRRLLPRQVVESLSGVVMGTLLRSMDRVAFGTTASYDMYAGYVGRQTLAGRSRLFEAVPAPCACVDAADRRPDDRSVVFVGAFTARKGIGELMEVWDVVRRQRPGLRLTIIGKGVQEKAVRAWADARPEVAVIVDPQRDVIHRSLRKATCCILLSQRVGGWREQVGLPIVEALAHGCEVVTTEETGLAQWLRAHGHVVVAAEASPVEVATQVLRRIDAPRAARLILEQLPGEDQRLAADRWMSSVVASGRGAGKISAGQRAGT